MVLEIILGSFLISLTFILSRVFKERTHPAIAFLATWGGIITLIALVQPIGYYQIHFLTLLLYLSGALLFTTGALIGDSLALHSRVRPVESSTAAIDFRRLALFCVLIHLFILPKWWGEIVAMADGQTDLIALSFALRILTASEGEKLSALVGNYLVSGFVFVPILAIGVARSKLHWISATVVSAPWVLANIITNGRSALVQLVLVFFYVYAIKTGRVKWKAILGIFAIFSTILIAGVILVGKGDTSIDDGTGSILRAVGENTVEYAVQGPILFSRYFENPNLINPTWDALSFPCQLLEHLDACKVEPLHQDYLDFNSDGQNGNVYSLYLSLYPKYGIFGVVLLSLLYGVWASYHHRRAYDTHSVIHTLIAAYLFAAAVLSVFSDLFAPSLNFFIKLVLLTAIVQLIFKERSQKNASV